MRALEFGPFKELIKKYGNQQRLKDMPKETITKPSVVFKPSEPKKVVIPWDATLALKLWQKRQPYEGEPLPDIFAEMSEVSEAPRDIVGRNKLVLKSKSSTEQKYYTTDDE